MILAAAISLAFALALDLVLRGRAPERQPVRVRARRQKN